MTTERLRPPPQEPANVQIDVIVRSARWQIEPGAENTVKKAIRAAAIAVSTPAAELAIVLGDDSAIRALNRKWRGQNAPTNVLAFPAAAAPGKAPAASPYIGDIVIAYQTTAREAAAEGKPLSMDFCISWVTTTTATARRGPWSGWNAASSSASRSRILMPRAARNPELRHA